MESDLDGARNWDQDRDCSWDRDGRDGSSSSTPMHLEGAAIGAGSPLKGSHFRAGGRPRSVCSVCLAGRGYSLRQQEEREKREKRVQEGSPIPAGSANGATCTAPLPPEPNRRSGVGIEIATGTGIVTVLGIAMEGMGRDSPQGVGATDIPQIHISRCRPRNRGASPPFDAS